MSALINKKIIVHGGSQKRPNIHIEDMTDCYVKMLEYPDRKIAGKTYNVGYNNYTLINLATMVKKTLADPRIQIVTEYTPDLRSYHISSAKILKELNFKAKHSVETAIRDIAKAYKQGKIPKPMEDIRYYNLKTMQAAGLS